MEVKATSEAASRHVGAEGAGGGLKFVAGFDAVEGEPVEVGFEGVGDLVAVAFGAGQVGVGDARVARLHVVDFEDDAVPVDVGDGERDEGAFHPKFRRLDGGQDEDHAVVVAELGTKHEASFFLRAGGGDLGGERGLADVERDLGELADGVGWGGLGVGGENERGEECE